MDLTRIIVYLWVVIGSFNARKLAYSGPLYFAPEHIASYSPTQNQENDTSSTSGWFCKTKLTNEQLRSGIIGEKYRWRNGLNIYPDPVFTAKERAIIISGTKEIASHLCIPVKIWPLNSKPTGDYVQILRGKLGSGCWSNVGRQGGKQFLNLDHTWCIKKYIVMHELFHALGFYHEHERLDRDDYVTVFYENISPAIYDQFAKEMSTTFGVPYDIYSIMHYSSYQGSINHKPTILAKNGSKVGTKGILTSNDVQKLRKMYKC